MKCWYELGLKGVNCDKWTCRGYGGMEKASFLVMLKAFQDLSRRIEKAGFNTRLSHSHITTHTHYFFYFSFIPFPTSTLMGFSLFLFSIPFPTPPPPPLPRIPGPCLKRTILFSWWPLKKKEAAASDWDRTRYVNTQQQLSECAKEWLDHVRKPTHTGCSGKWNCLLLVNIPFPSSHHMPNLKEGKHAKFEVLRLPELLQIHQIHAHWHLSKTLHVQQFLFGRVFFLPLLFPFVSFVSTRPL